MSGHSKWAQIKRQKGVQDIKRGNIFTKLANAIVVAAKESGKDPETNFKLRLAVEKAKSYNMPLANIERAIKRGAGELQEGGQIEEVEYEALGPAGSAFILEIITDNKNRTVSDLRNLLTKYGGRLGEAKSVRWMFERKGVIRITSPSNKEERELKLIDVGASDFEESEEGLTIYTESENFFKVKEYLEKEKINIIDAGQEFVPKEKLELKDEGLKKKLDELLTALEDSAEVNNYYTNVQI